MTQEGLRDRAKHNNLAGDRLLDDIRIRAKRSACYNICEQHIVRHAYLRTNSHRQRAILILPSRQVKARITESICDSHEPSSKLYDTHTQDRAGVSVEFAQCQSRLTSRSPSIHAATNTRVSARLMPTSGGNNRTCRQSSDRSYP